MQNEFYTDIEIDINIIKKIHRNLLLKISTRLLLLQILLNNILLQVLTTFWSFFPLFFSGAKMHI